MSELMPLYDMRWILPELLMAVSAVVLLMVGAFGGNRTTPLIGLAVAAVLAVSVYLVSEQLAMPRAAFHQMFLSDGFTRFAKGMLLVGALLVLILSFGWLRMNEHCRFEYPVLFLLSLVGMMLMISANDLMALYLGLELSSLSLYVMASFNRDSVRSTEAGLKYFVLGALASGMMLFGSSLVYGFTGTTNFSALGDLFEVSTAKAAAEGVAMVFSPGLVVGMVLLIVGFCFKVSAAPFHMWTPDVYEGAPTPVTAFFALAPKIAALTLFARVLAQPFGDLLEQWQQVIIVVSVASMLVGAFGAITQTNIKRLLAYSSIGHVGYALVGLAVGTTAGIQALLIYLAIYLVMNAGAFGCVLLLRRNGEYVEEIEELSGLSKTQPRLAMMLAIFMFSMAGIPPLAGFFGKMYVFLAAVEKGMLTLAVIGVLTSVVSCYYYLKIIKQMYFDEEKAPFDRDAPLSTRYVLSLCAVLTLFFFLYPTPLVSYAKAAAQALHP